METAALLGAGWDDVQEEQGAGKQPTASYCLAATADCLASPFRLLQEFSGPPGPFGNETWSREAVLLPQGRSA